MMRQSEPPNEDAHIHRCIYYTYNKAGNDDEAAEDRDDGHTSG